ncbi:MAG: 50S ribosomal protein L18 [Candidatus Latescibacteria bacterium]|nr:50S ribosomal protein L18 [Candidatus Latescibacterota bacterium]
MKDTAKNRIESRLKRKVRVRKKVSGTAERPRLTVSRSHKAIYAQIIDDVVGNTLLAADSRKADDAAVPEGLAGKCATAYRVGHHLARLAREKGIEKAVFDRNGYLYHGRVAALAKGARDGGLEF